MAYEEVQLGLFEPVPEEAPELWQVRRSKRARRIAIHILPHGGVEIVAPHRAPPDSVREFVEQQTEWIENSRNEMLKNIEAQGPLLPEVVELKAIGRNIEVHYDIGEKPTYSMQADRLAVRAPDITPTDVWPVLKRWLRELGRKHIPPLLQKQSEVTGLSPARVQIRNQKTRWGSCSSNRTISLNAAILLLEPEQADYVLIHELCHLTHMNHSERYWGLVMQYVPEFRALDRAVDQFWETGPAWPR